MTTKVNLPDREKVKYSKLLIGDWFLWDKVLYRKLQGDRYMHGLHSKIEYWNCQDLYVTPVDVEITVKYK